jgi:hypothetical protein
VASSLNPYLAADPLLSELRKEPDFVDILTISHQHYQASRDRFF